MNKKALLGFIIISVFVFTSVSFIASVQFAAINRKADVIQTLETDSLAKEVTVKAADGTVNRYAVIVGISDYKAINDLSYCDEDATDWYNFLSTKGYVCKVLGDPTNYYPRFDGLASEYNVKTAITSYLSTADADDIVVFASSGHGTTYRSGKTKGQTLCMWDYGAGENGQDGSFRDTELDTLYDGRVCKWFIFLDHCYSGGMNEVMANANKANGYLTTTCTATGYGYDMPEYNNGAWTYFFLQYSWINHFGGNLGTSMETIFTYAKAAYPFTNKDAPQQFDGNTALPYYL